jgi:hypothetical protein
VPTLADSYLDTAATSEEDRLWGSAVSIRRGSLTTTGVTAQKFSGQRLINLDGGNWIQWFGCEWIVPKSRYKISALVTTPKRGDRIIEADGTEWELQPIEELSEAQEQEGGLEWMLRTQRVKAA